MSADLIDGKAFAARVRAEVASGVAALKARTGIVPGLTVVLVGDDPASQVYVKNKGVQTREAGMNSDEIRLPASATQAQLLATAVHGILVQLPLPAQIDANAVITAIDPAKDVDGFHPVNVGRLALGQGGFVPCTPLGCLLLLRDTLGKLSGANALVIGRSGIVGRPMASLLIGESCTVTVAHSKTRDLPALCAQADIVVAAIGRPRFVKGAWIRLGATVIDVGINRIPAEGGKTRLVGDVEFEAAAERARAITPVPGGVGPMTIACLLRNTLAAATPA